jgi:UDP-N-acetylglucosamine--N-acetylmuramyl-(pentapeptide) pyrophosphoryl-undecaprenol N-acetylglucosamine transferase
MNNMSRKYIISGGGTGGHIFPALSIANEIRKRDPGAGILFVGATGRMEMEKIPAAGYPIMGLPVEGLQRKLGLRNIVVVYKLIISLFKAYAILRTFKPDVAVGVGGYASGPLLRIASWKKIPSLIQEQNSYAGVTNRLLARKASRICVAYTGMEKYFPAAKIVLTGNPVREELFHNTPDRKAASEYFKVSADKPVLLILGGSLGARTINNSILAHIETLGREDIEIIWQTGRLYVEGIRNALGQSQPGNVKYFDFIQRMDMAYAVADVIISRAGAATISEICLLGKPAILVPSPNVAEDHQTKNAMALVKNRAAIMVPDGDAHGKLVPLALELIHDLQLRESLGSNCARMALPNAASKIVDEIIKLAGKSDLPG